MGQLAQFLRLAAQLVTEHLGVGPGSGDVLAGDDLFLGTVDHRGEDGATGVVKGAFAGEGAGAGERQVRGMPSDGVEGRHSIQSIGITLPSNILYLLTLLFG